MAMEQERILSFHSAMVIHPDGSMTVTETIRVRVTGEEIQHGIYRQFPTRDKDRYGNWSSIGFKLLEVRRDGLPEKYRIENYSGVIMIYIGKDDHYLEPGDYTYELVYRTDRHLGYFNDHDELYWNVTGNGWSFSIDETSAEITLPAAVDQYAVKLFGYTGPAGSTTSNCHGYFSAPNKVYFKTTQPLTVGEGLTVKVTWPKGLVYEPTAQERQAGFLRDNLSSLAGFGTMLILLVYYIVVWVLVGRDPQKGVIIPRYQPPQGISPAAARYIWQMGFDNKTFAAVLINMAVKGYLIINQNNSDFVLEKGKADRSVLTPDESSVAESLDLEQQKIELVSANHVIIHKALEALQEKLRLSCQNHYFKTNIRYFKYGAIFSAVFMLVVSFSEYFIIQGLAALFLPSFMLLFDFGILLGIISGIQEWYRVFRESMAGEKNNLLTATVQNGLGITILTVIAVFITKHLLITIIDMSSTLFFLLVVCCWVVNYMFYKLLKAPTLKGRSMLDELEGFRLYLSIAEKERLNLLNPSEKTPELFEVFLPYALALDVEQDWAEQFADVFDRLPSGGEYSPSWYSRGTSWERLSSRELVSGLAEMPRAIASSSTASRSGSRGSSGGGRGGGGGGGW